MPNESIGPGEVVITTTPAEAPVAAPVLTNEAIAAIPAASASIAPRRVPYKRWLLAGAVVLALLGGGAWQNHRKAAVLHPLTPTPIASVVLAPEPPKAVECVPQAPLVAPLPTIPPVKLVPPTDGFKKATKPKREQRRP